MAVKAVPVATNGFSQAQIEQLLRPINPVRVLTDGKGFSHVSQQDILAHLTRIFGFGNFDIEVKNVELVFEHERGQDRYDTCYKALVRLTVRNEAGQEVCHFENGSMETSQNQKRGDGHDLAYKSAISLSIKRACIALGDQFGLSLYNKGQMSALVRSTLVGLPVTEAVDVQEGVTKQVSLGNDETEASTEAPRTPVIAPVVAIAPPEPKADIKPQVEVVKDPTVALVLSAGIANGATTLDQLRNLWTQNSKNLDVQFDLEGHETSLRVLIDLRHKEIEAKK